MIAWEPKEFLGQKQKVSSLLWLRALVAILWAVVIAVAFKYSPILHKLLQ